MKPPNFPVSEQDARSSAASNDLVVDRIYQIALDPASLDDFIDFWHDTDLPLQITGTESGDSKKFDGLFKTHLDRAQMFLQREEDALPDLMAYLQPYDSLPAFIVNGSLHIEALNQGAYSIFDAKAGNNLDQLRLPAEIMNALIRTTQNVLHRPQNSEKLLKVELPGKGGSILFRVMQIDKIFEDGPAALIVSAQFHWRNAISTLLGSAFQLTKAEQGVVRLLVEGKNTSAIATERNTSEGTTRGQIKSITGKMNVRSQADIVRLVMTLNKFPEGTNQEMDTAKLASPGFSGNWLEAEVWKPFKSITLPDQRQLTYHDMGPITGNPVLLSHMGSCMVRWSYSMTRLAFKHNLRVICPIRAGYGHSDNLPLNANPFDATGNDCEFLLKSLGILRLPYAVQGSDFPLAVHLIANRPEIVSELIGIGGQLRLPNGQHVEGAGRWQRFFVSTARNTPNLVHFASKAVMAMCRRIGPEEMLRQLCKDSPSDLALLDIEEMKKVLVANISLMAGKSTDTARAFAMEYIAFQEDWSDHMMATSSIPVQILLAQEDPTIDLSALPKFQEAYPWITFEIVQNAGLALMFQKPEKLIPLMAKAAQRAAKR